MAFAFKRFVFFQAATADRERIAAMQILFPQLDAARIHFADSLLDIEALDAGDLLVCCGDSLKAAYRSALASGLVTALSWSDFRKNMAHAICLQSPGVFGEVVLAFLPELLRAQAVRLFNLFGFNAVAVDSSQALLRELKHGATLVVFDQDMPTLKRGVQENRDKIFSLLRSERRQRRQLAVILIKDFDQGSLFEDMTTLAKDVSNAMLAPNEFLEFIRNYLCDFQINHATWKLKTGTAVGLAQTSYTGRPSASLGLADIKGAFSFLQDKAYHDFMLVREQMIVEAHDLAVRMSATEWLFDKQLLAESETMDKALLVKSEVPFVFARSLPQIQVAEAPSDDSSARDALIN